MPLFTREFVSCQAQPFHSHLYDDPVMLICSHVFCRSCCLTLAQKSKDKSILCPLCSCRISFNDPNQFVQNLISHGTLTCMVKQYLREENNQQICYSCQNNYIKDKNEKLCRKCQIENEDIKKKIVETIANCEDLLANQKMIALEKVQKDIKQLYEIINQRERELIESIDQYQKELKDLLERQKQANEMNALKHQSIDIETVSGLVEPRLNALKNHENFSENIQVEKEINRLNIEADRQLRLLKHKSDIVPVLSPSNLNPSPHLLLLGELLFKSMETESKTSHSSSFSSMVNASGDTSLQSIPLKSPMWTTSVRSFPDYLCVYPSGKSTLIFSCSSTGVISLLTYISPVTYDSPRSIRTFNLFPQQTRLSIQSFTVFNRFILLHLQETYENGLVYLFSNDGVLEHEPIQLPHPIYQYLADENRLWAINSLTHTIYSHAQPIYTHEISSTFSKHEEFISFSNRSDFLPIRMSINQQSLALLSQDLQQVFIYNKNTREQIFTSHFSAGQRMNIWDISLFPRDNSLLLKFDLSFDGNIRRSLFIHFNTKNQSVGRIEGRHCLGVVIGPNKEILIGFQLRTGVIRCYM